MAKRVLAKEFFLVRNEAEANFVRLLLSGSMGCTSQANVARKASLASYHTIVVPCSGFYSSTIIDYDLFKNISKASSFSYGFLLFRRTNRKIHASKRWSNLRIVSRWILSELAQNVEGAKRYPSAIRLIEYLRAKGLPLAYRFLVQFHSPTFLLGSLPSSVRYQKYRML